MSSSATICSTNLGLVTCWQSREWELISWLGGTWWICSRERHKSDCSAESVVPHLYPGSDENHERSQTIRTSSSHSWHDSCSWLIIWTVIWTWTVKPSLLFHLDCCIYLLMHLFCGERENDKINDKILIKNKINCFCQSNSSRRKTETLTMHNKQRCECWECGSECVKYKLKWNQYLCLALTQL